MPQSEKTMFSSCCHRPHCPKAASTYKPKIERLTPLQCCPENNTLIPKQNKQTKKENKQREKQ